MQQNPHSENNMITGSFSNDLGSFDLAKLDNSQLSDSERVLSVLARSVIHLQKEVSDLKENKIKDLQLTPEQLEESGLEFKPIRHLKRGIGFRPLLKGEIEEAKKHSYNEAGAARWLNVSFQTYKKYCKMYGLWQPQIHIRDKKAMFDPNKGKYRINDILQCKYPDLEIWKIRDKLIRSGKKEAKCENCGYCERRITDGKIPLILNFMDGNSKNHTLENMKIYCYNCTFNCGRGYIHRGKHYFDPDHIEGATKDQIFDESRF